MTSTLSPLPLLKRSLIILIYSAFNSIPMNGRLLFFAAKHSLPEPAKGTRTYPSLAVCLHDLISLSHKAKGFCVG